MTDDLPGVLVVDDVSVEQFRDELYPAGQPVLMRGAIRDWPAVRAASESAESLAGYLARFDCGRAVETLFGRPEIAGRFFYNERLDGLNFERRNEHLAASVECMLAMRGKPAPPSIYIQSAPIPDCLPGFDAENRLALVDAGVVPRIWVGNRLTVQTHFDLSENIACAVAGRRRFTLFPPAQTPNLYPGPFELTLAGPPVSMVQPDAPDFDRYPRFRDALAEAQQAELAPGDALYIPYFWWHHVQALDDLNVLVNYWWNDAAADLGSPFDALLHAILALRDLPERQRQAWQTMFGHYAFADSETSVGHLPEHSRGALGRHDLKRRQHIRRMLISALGRQAGIRPPPGKP